MNGLFCGVTTVDIVFYVDHPAGSNEKVRASEVMYFAGGPATNASISFQVLGGNSSLLSGISETPLLSIVKFDLEKYNIKHINLFENENYIFPISSIQVDKNGYRSITSSAGLNIPASISKYPELNFDNIQIVLTDGWSVKIISALLQKCQNIPIVFDGGSWKDGTELILPYLTYAICSENFCPPNCPKDFKEISIFLSKRGVKNIAFTRGDKSILAYVENHLIEIPVKQIIPVDTLGAGDIFHGAFCFYILQSFNFVDSLKKASEVASLSCQYRGTREWINYL